MKVNAINYGWAPSLELFVPCPSEVKAFCRNAVNPVIGGDV